jgi:membrane-bound lytic murein transglycosylase D
MEFDTSQFKEPECITENIDFWESVYRTHQEGTEISHPVDFNFVGPPRPNQIRKQSGIKNRFEAGIAREKTYWPIISKYLAGVPRVIGLLPHVESSFNPQAQSKVGATGMWQIMPGTGKLYGLKSKNALKNVEKSTEVAIQILKENYAELGSWPLALTAYNHGLHGIKRAVKETGSTDFCTIVNNYNGPRFKFASKNFYAQFLAVLRIRKQEFPSK